MKTINLFFAALLGLASLSALGQGRKALEEKYGFRDLKFETDTSSAKGLRLMAADGRDAYYSRPSDELKIGAARLKEIVYGYSSGRLATVRAVTVSGDGEALKSALLAQYGRPWVSSNYGKSCMWGSKSVTLSYEENSAGGADMLMLSKPMREGRQLSEREAGKAAKGDL